MPVTRTRNCTKYEWRLPGQAKFILIILALVFAWHHSGFLMVVCMLAAQNYHVTIKR